MTFPKFIITFFVSVVLANAQDDFGKQTFTSCSLCHGPDGKGATAGDLLMAPSLFDSPFVKSKNPEALVAIILKGIHKEDAKYLQQMVPLEAALDDKKIAAVTTYVHNEFGGHKTELNPAKIANWRKKYSSQGGSWKRQELAQLAARLDVGSLISNLKFSVYDGKWEELPDFSVLKPVQTGSIKSNKISLGVVKNQQRPFGIIFEGDLTIKHSDAYHFALLAFNSGALIIDGENVITANPKNMMEIIKATEKLEAGQHTFKVHYIFNSGKPKLGLSATSKTLGEVTLSQRPLSSKKRKKPSFPPILLTPKDGEAIVHRAFLPKEKPRAIGVAYPGGINLSWNADTLNLSQLWRGNFMDVAPHWNHRGSSSQPLGEAPQKPAVGFPFQILETADEAWIPFSEGKIKYERDTANPKKNITFNLEHPDYQFGGYRLDEHRFPTFHYTYRDLKVTDNFSPTILDGKDVLIRTLTLTGTPDKNLHFRLSNQAPGKPLPDEPDWINLGDLALKIDDAKPTLRKSEVLIPITDQSKIQITYRWSAPRKSAK